MKILMVHNYYRYRGGEDESTEQDVQLLRGHGHTVQTFYRHSTDIASLSPLRLAGLPFSSVFSPQTYHRIRRVLSDLSPDIVHVQNFFPLVSPAVFYACHAANVPVVLTLHNYRLLCPAALFFRNGAICEDCRTGSLINAVRHRCYHNSRLQTAALCQMLLAHRYLRTWFTKVDRFICLTRFSMEKFAQAGLPIEKISIRPNFVGTDPGVGTAPRAAAIFVGRLSTEKGIEFLLRAWKQMPDVPLTIVGDGPLRPWCELYVRSSGMTHVQLIGQKSHPETIATIQKASVLVMTSGWYETFGRSIIEAYASGTPVVATRLGAMAELVEDGRTGYLFESGNETDFADKVRRCARDPANNDDLGRNARATFVANYSAAPAYQQLLAIYQKVIDARKLPPERVPYGRI